MAISKALGAQINQALYGITTPMRVRGTLIGFTDRLAKLGYTRGEYHEDKYEGIFNYPHWTFEQGELDINYVFDDFGTLLTHTVLVRCINIKQENIGEGFGRKVLNDLMGIADELKATLIAVIDPAYFGNKGLDEKQIADWLIRNDFKPWHNHRLNTQKVVYRRIPK